MSYKPKNVKAMSRAELEQEVLRLREQARFTRGLLNNASLGEVERIVAYQIYQVTLWGQQDEQGFTLVRNSQLEMASSS